MNPLLLALAAALALIAQHGAEMSATGVVPPTGIG